MKFICEIFFNLDQRLRRCILKLSTFTGFKLGPGIREKGLLPPGKLGRSESQIERSYSAKLGHILSI